jgi:hypothetical protein
VATIMRAIFACTDPIFTVTFAKIMEVTAHSDAAPKALNSPRNGMENPFGLLYNNGLKKKTDEEKLVMPRCSHALAGICQVKIPVFS